MKILFTICARAGSKGFKNKNIKELKGVPLVYYTLAAIDLFGKDNDCEYDIALNTDSEELIKQVNIQKAVNDVRFIERKDELSGNKSAKVDVIRDTYMTLLENDKKYDVIVDLDLTSPMRSADDIRGVIDELVNNSNLDLTFSVVPSRRSPYFNMVEMKENGFYRKICDSDFTTRQESPKCFDLNASIYAYRPGFLEKEISKTILEYKCGIYVMTDYLVLDIDTEDDMKYMEILSDHYFSANADLNAAYNKAREIADSVVGNSYE